MVLFCGVIQGSFFNRQGAHAVKAYTQGGQWDGVNLTPQGGLVPFGLC